ncbi:glycosyltransferase family 39 protein [Bizionia sp.]|uniref:glycosyltransferase family 39 protein n=1 Tax=Bizionia sp. TaxID=1954480 RepID=UPI003A8EFD46
MTNSLYRLPDIIKKKYQLSILFVYFCTIILGSTLYFNFIPNPLWVGNTLFQIIFFILYSQFIFKLSQGKTESNFLKLSFVFNVLVGSIWVIIIYAFYSEMSGYPFEFHAKDGLNYYTKGKEIAGLIPHLGFFSSVDTVLSGEFGFSDYGFFAYNAVLIFLFGDNIIIERLLNVIWLALAAIYLYKISKLCFSNKTYAVVALILMVAVPNFYVYAAGNRKEILMIFFLLGFTYYGLRVLHSGDITTANILLTCFFLVLIFFMRPILCLVGLYALFIAYINSTYFKGKIISKAFIWFGVFTSVIIVLIIAGDELLLMWDYSQVATESNNTNKANSSGGDLSAYPIWFYFSLFPFAPVSGFIELPGKENEMFMAGAHFIKVLYTALFIFGSVVAYKFKSARWIFHFIVIYFLALAINGYTVDTRFHMVLLPFIFLIVPFSTEINFRFKWTLYCGFCFLSIFFITAWNYFRIGIWI